MPRIKGISYIWEGFEDHFLASPLAYKLRDIKTVTKLSSSGCPSKVMPFEVNKNPRTVVSIFMKREVHSRVKWVLNKATAIVEQYHLDCRDQGLGGWVIMHSTKFAEIGTQQVEPQTPHTNCQARWEVRQQTKI